MTKAAGRIGRVLRVTTMALASFTFQAVAGDVKVNHFYGYARDLKTDRYLYTEVYTEREQDGRWIGGSTRYVAPDGSALGERTISFKDDRYIPVYRLNLPLAGYSDGITAVNADSVEAFKENRKKGRRTATLARSTDVPMAADGGFHNLIVDHLDTLAAGQPLKFKLLVSGQLDSFSFVAEKSGDAPVDGKPALHLRVQPDSLLRFAMDPLQLTYDPASRRLLEYRGVSNVIDAASGEAYVVRITFDPAPPPDAPKTLPPLE